MTFKRVTGAVAGDASHFGGQDVNKFSDYLGGTDISGSETVDINTATKFRDSKLRLRNPANTFEYTLAPSAITADRTITLPALTGNDTPVFLGHTNAPTGETFAIRRTGSGAQGFELGSNDVTGGASYIDFHTDSGDGDYRTRFNRGSGADGVFDITQTGKNGVRIQRTGIALDTSWSALLQVISTVTSTPTTGPDWPTMRVTTNYQADDVTDPLDLVPTGLISRLEYGQSGTPAVGTGHATTIEVEIEGSANTSNEIAASMGWSKAKNASQASQWFTDWSLHGPVAAQPGLLSGVTMLVNNHYNGACVRGGGRTYAFGAITKQNSGGNNQGDVATYKLTYGFGVHGYCCDAGGANARRGWDYGMLIGSFGASWSGSSASKIGTGIRIDDVEDFGIDIKDPATGTASANVTGIAFTNSVRPFNPGIDLSTGTFTNNIAIKGGATHIVQLGTNQIRQGQWRNSGTGNMGLEFGPDDATGGDVYQDWHFSNTDGDYASRIIRYTGTNSRFEFINSGTGHIRFQANGIEISGYHEFEKIAAPTDPATEDARLYLKTVDGSNNALFVKVKQAGVVTEKRIAFV